LDGPQTVGFLHFIIGPCKSYQASAQQRFLSHCRLLCRSPSMYLETQNKRYVSRFLPAMEMFRSQLAYPLGPWSLLERMRICVTMHSRFRHATRSPSMKKYPTAYQVHLTHSISKSVPCCSFHLKESLPACFVAKILSVQHLQWRSSQGRRCRGHPRLVCGTRHAALRSSPRKSPSPSRLSKLRL
jgi:hypothetical protein